ncbi:cupin domain-containing protein [Rhodococcus sp. NPDC003318]|uniref:cupin domain-containing protein n=1 Tax=Rhodococcus sp. NPDC003318 TaxID=3364503 RepID=UPI00369E80E4
MTTIARAGETRSLTLPDAIVTLLHSGTDHELFLVDAGPGESQPLHSEPWAKTYCILAGRIRVRFLDAETELGPGDSITFDGGTMNGFTVCTPTARFLLISAGDRMSRFFGDLAGVTGERDVGAVAARYGIVLAGEAGAP